MPLQPLQKEKTFEEQWDTGPLTCDGFACNPNPKHQCSEPERWLCRDVISQEILPGYFRGQFELKLPYIGSRWPDFAIETPAGKRIVVELDGHGPHVNLSREKFNKHV